jgi:hypothetical protein
LGTTIWKIGLCDAAVCDHDDELHYLLAQMSEVVKNMQGANANVLA